LLGLDDEPRLDSWLMRNTESEGNEQIRTASPVYREL
jgi:hypothetical protein